MNENIEVIWQIRNDSSLDLDEQVTKLVMLGTPAVPYLLSILEKPNNDLFDLSVRALCSIGESVVPELIKKLKSHKQITRLYAARILTNYGEIAIPYIRNEYVTVNNTSQKLRLLKIIGSIGYSDAKAILENALRSKDRKIQTEAAKALAQAGLEGIKTLIISLEDKKGVNFSDPRIKTILRGGRFSAAHLKTIIQEDEVPYSLRSKAALILGKLSNFSSIEKLYIDSNNLEIKKLSLIAMESYPGSEKIRLFIKGIDHKGIIDPNARGELEVCEQAAISLANAVYNNYFSYLSPLYLDEEVINRVVVLAQSKLYKVRIASFKILFYVQNSYANQVLKELFFQARTPITTRLEIVVAFMIYLIKRGEAYLD